MKKPRSSKKASVAPVRFEPGSVSVMVAIIAVLALVLMGTLGSM